MTKEEIKAILDKRRGYGGVEWVVRSLFNISFHGMVRGLRAGGIDLNHPIESEDEVMAIADLVTEKYKDREPLFLGRNTIPGDSSAPTQEELMKRIGSKAFSGN